MSNEKTATKQEQPKEAPKFARELDLFAQYVNGFTAQERNSRRNRIAGTLSIGTEKGMRDIVEVSTQKLLDRELGYGLVQRALDASKAAAEVADIDLRSASMAASLEGEGGVTKILTVSVDRSADRLQHTHGNMSDKLTYSIWTIGSEAQDHRVEYTVGLNGQVAMSGPNGDVKIHANSEAANIMQAQIDAFPPLAYAPNLPF